MKAISWSDDLLRIAVLAGMVCSFILSPVFLAESLKAGWDGSYVVLLCGLAAAEGYISYRVRGRPRADAGSPLPYLLAELFVLFCLVQLYGDAADGQAPFQDWQPVLNVGMLWSFIPVLLTWIVARDVAGLLDLLGDHPARSFQVYAPTRRLAARYFIGGVLLFAVAGLTQVRIARLMQLPHGSESGPLANVLLYFVLGAVMLGHVQYSSLRQRWRDRDYAIDRRLGRRWARYSLLFVALVVIVALLLPTGHTLGLLGSGRVLWDQFLALLRDPLLWLLRLLGRTSAPLHPTTIPRNLHVTPPPHLPPLHHATHRPHGHGSTVNWGALVQSFLFWTVVAACGLYLLRSYLQRRPQLSRASGASAAALVLLARLWSTLRDLVRRSRSALAERLPRRLSPGVEVSLGAPPLHFVRHGALTPREQILQYYLRMLRRAERQGLARQPSQTPQEFEPPLIASLPEARNDVHDLTNAFVQARYGLHEPAADAVRRALDSWQRIRTALRKIRT